MLPKHQTIIDEMLLQVDVQCFLLERSLAPVMTSTRQVTTEEELSARVEQLRESSLGKDVQRLVAYVEGYDDPLPPERERDWARAQERPVGGMRRLVYRVCRVLYGSAQQGRDWHYPKGSQHTPMGRLVHAALLRFYREYIPREQLVSVAEMVKKSRLSRQTLHECMHDGTIRWIYDAEHDKIWIDRDEVARLYRRRGKRAQDPRVDDLT